MFLYGYTTSYLQRPFVMPMSYASTYQVPLYNMQLYGGGASLFGNLGSSSSGYTQIANPSEKIELPREDITYSSSLGSNYGTSTGGLFGNWGFFNNFSFTQLITKPVASLFNTKSTRRTGSTTNTTFSTVAPQYTGTNATVQKALQLAYGELNLGVKENNGSNDSKEIRKYKKGAINHDEWCGYFVSWLYADGQKRNNKNTFGYQANSQAMRKKAQAAGFYASKNSGYIPKPGDIMVIKKSEYKGHVGIVTKVYSNGSFDTIEGNAGGGRVKTNHNTIKGRANLDGFIRMGDWLNAT